MTFERRAKPAHWPVQLDIIIVGGGIAGFAAAATLRRLGHNILLLEKSSFKREAGFMITLGTNATRVLASIDFDFVRSQPVDCDYYELRNGVTLEKESSLSTRLPVKEDTEHTRTFYRPDLHAELQRIALAPSAKYSTPTLLFGSEVVAVDIEHATVTLANGDRLKGDLIIAADGERSIVKAAFADLDSLRQAPFKIFRAIIPTEKIVEDESAAKLLAMTRKKFAMFGSDLRTISWFEGHDGTLQDIEAGYSTRDLENRRAEPDHAKAKAQMLEIFSDFHPDLLNVMRKAEKVTDWEVYSSKPLPHLFKGKAILIGDAAHSMLPTTGQGGCQGIEDVGALSVLLSDISDISELSGRFEIIERLRKDRAAIIQSLSGLRLGQEENFMRSHPGHLIHRTGIRNGKDHLEFLFNYDVIAESRKALQRDLRPRALL